MVKTLSPAFPETFLRTLGVSFDDLQHLTVALTHRSFGLPHNERLEFLGDSILDAVVSSVLFETFPDLPEGDLSRLRASLVCEETLCQLSSHLGIGDFLRIGDGERKSGGAHKPSLLADAFEAVIGATFLDGGFAKASTFIRLQYAGMLTLLDPAKILKDPKTRLQEWLQARRHALPQYTVEHIEGSSHAQRFFVRCELSAPKLQATGSGTNRRQAEQDAATQLLACLEDEVSQ